MRIATRRRLVLLLVGAAMGPASSVWAQAAPASRSAPAKPAEKKEEPTPDVTFAHDEGKARIYDLDLNHGQRFVVRVSRTCPAAFDYSYESVPRGTRNNESDLPKKDPLTNKDIPLVYDQQFGGYVFHVTQKPDVKPGDKCDGGEALTSQSFIVSVRQQRWNLSFSGAFTISGLTDPEFSVKAVDGVKTVVRETDKENERKLGVASFVHLFHDGVQWKQLQPALGFGLGINDQERAEYMMGGAIRFGDRATFNVGRVWGSITRLPNGVTLNGPATDDNILSNLGRQTVSRWFVALSYAFIDTKDRLTKPFAPETAKPAAAADAPAEATGTKATNDESIGALKFAASQADTYEDDALKAVLKPASGAREMCPAAITAPVDSKVDVTVNVKNASTDDLRRLNDAGAKAADAIAAAAKKKLAERKKILGLGVNKVTFAAACQ